MIKLSELPKSTVARKKRLGQGHGSGRGKTGGRGTKGQHAREIVSATFSGGDLAMVRRLPLIRGKYRNRTLKAKPICINLKYLNTLPDGTTVDISTLSEYHIVKRDEAELYGVKILGDGDLKKRITVVLPISKSAAKKVTAAGGTVGKPSIHE